MRSYRDVQIRLGPRQLLDGGCSDCSDVHLYEVFREDADGQLLLIGQVWQIREGFTGHNSTPHNVMSWKAQTHVGADVTGLWSRHGVSAGFTFCSRSWAIHMLVRAADPDAKDIAMGENDRRHPAAVTADRLLSHIQRWYDRSTPPQRDNLAAVRSWLLDIAEQDRTQENR